MPFFDDVDDEGEVELFIGVLEELGWYSLIPQTNRKAFQYLALNVSVLNQAFWFGAEVFQQLH